MTWAGPTSLSRQHSHSFITNPQLTFLSHHMTFHLFTKKPTIEPDTRRPPPHTPSSGAVRRLHVPPSTSLSKQHSWSPDLIREEAWSKRRDTSRNRRRGKSLTDDDLDELKASIELGFGFGSPEVTDPRLSNTLPALELYYAVQKSYNDAVSNKSSSSLSDGDTSPSTLYRTSMYKPIYIYTQQRICRLVVLIRLFD